MARLRHVSAETHADGARVRVDTCPHAVFNRYHRIIAEHLALPDNEIVVCCMSIGYADLSQPENVLVSRREEVGDLVRFLRCLR